MKCGRCGGRLRRIHRTFLERFQFLAIFECLECNTQHCAPRPYQFHFGPEARCPQCGTTRLNRVKRPNKIDGMRGGVVNLFNRITGGQLMRCRYCRMQFYDRRPVMVEVTAAAGQEVDAVGS
jgi:DNA-directed RNA polymerase subunit RPC12/RpoP